MSEVGDCVPEKFLFIMWAGARGTAFHPRFFTSWRVKTTSWPKALFKSEESIYNTISGVME